MNWKLIFLILACIIAVPLLSFGKFGEVIHNFLFNDGTTTTLQSPAGDYFRVGTNCITQEGLSDSNDTVVCGDLEVQGNVHFQGSAGFEPIFAGLTLLTYDGNQVNYDTADSRCEGNFPDSHVCRVGEILHMINNDVVLPIAGEGWINGGPPGFTANANDCQGWSTNAVNNFGRYWDFATDQGWMRGCTNAVAFACCK